VKDYLNINEAAKVTGLSIPTIRAKLAKGLLPNASQIAEGKRKLWRIPFNDLLAAGLIDKTTPSDQDKADKRASGLELEVDRLTTELEHTKELLRRADEQIEDYRLLYRGLETRQVQEQRRSLWQRLRG